MRFNNNINNYNYNDVENHYDNDDDFSFYCFGMEIVDSQSKQFPFIFSRQKKQTTKATGKALISSAGIPVTLIC